MNKPENCTIEHLEFLDALRTSGSVNMCGSSTNLNNAFPDLTKREAIKIVSYWMRTFGQEDR